MQYNKVIKNPIMEVYWAGWRSDTLTLQRNGWQLAVDDDPLRRKLRIALHHPAMTLYGVTDFIQYELIEGKAFPPLMIGHMAPSIRFETIRSAMFKYDESFMPFDAVPQYSDVEVRSIEDMKIFRPLVAIQEIVVESQNVDELLGKILSMQSPRQAELREKARREQRRNENVYDLKQYREVYNPKSDIIAQVVSI